jgi:preprotein translocase subunit SecD
MQTAQQIMVNRLDKLGVPSPNVTIRGGNEIVVQLAGIHDPANAAKIIGSTGTLQFFDFEKDLVPPSVSGSGRPQPMASLYSVLKQLQGQAKKGSPEQYYLFGSKKQTTTIKHARLAGPDPQLHDLLLPYKGKQPAGTEILKVPAHREVVGSTSGKAWYVFKYFPTSAAHPDGPPEITGQDLNESGISADTNSGQAEVLLSFKKHGAHEFQAITKAEYVRGRIKAGEAGVLNDTNPHTVVQYAGRNAIVLDGVLESTPYIDYTDPILSLGIAGGSARITMGTGGVKAAKDLALVLQSGSLPYTFQRIGHSSCPR